MLRNIAIQLRQCGSLQKCSAFTNFIQLFHSKFSHTAKESFAGRIVRCAPILRHGALQLSLVHALNPAWSAVMAANIRMNRGPLPSLQSFDGVIRHSIDQFRIW